jgi:hypothetical protein
MGLEGHDVVPIGGLLGRFAALARLAGGLPDDLAARQRWASFTSPRGRRVRCHAS